MDNNDFLEFMKEHDYIDRQSPVLEKFYELSEEARKVTMELNNSYHTQEEIRELFFRLINKKIDPTFRMFPPFYTECGINITVGKNVFINACCKFQDQGGIEIGDNVLIGHGVSILTLNHDFIPENRLAMIPKSVKINSNVWIGSNSVILPGIKIVTKDVPNLAVVAGNPARIIKYIEK